MTLHIRAERCIWGDGIRLHAGEERPDGSIGVFQAPVAVAQEPGSHYGDPFLRLSTTDAQRLMDELWHCGLRPSEGSGSAGSLAATERHLKDMRTIAMGLLRDSGVEVA